jgi:RNA polymerase sigma-70 factor (ECF subfamily)
MSEAEIIQSVIAGNRNAFVLLVEKYQSMVFRTCIGFVHNKEDADDLTQEVFINAYQSLTKFRGNAAFSTWLYRIAINLSLNYIRNSQKRSIFHRVENLFAHEARQNVSLPAIDFSNPEQILIDDEHRNIIKKALDSLPENQRIAIILSKYDNLSQKEIAEIMQTTEGAVESLIQRGKAKLKQQLVKNR